MICRAAILIISCCIYLADIPAALHICTQMMKEESCCIKTCEAPEEEKSCSTETNDCESTCSNCPFLYVATMAPSFQLSPDYRLLKNQFCPYEVVYVNDFYAFAWKPPNGGGILNLSVSVGKDTQPII